VNDPDDPEDNSLLFSPQPPPKSDMLGARNPDSVLFDVRRLDTAEEDEDAEKSKQLDRIAAGGGGKQAGSGLINVHTLVANASEDGTEAAGPVVIEKTAAVVAEVAARPVMPVELPRSKIPGILVATTFVALIGVVVILAFEALR
jgi:hypothetical protein